MNYTSLEITYNNRIFVRGLGANLRLSQKGKITRIYNCDPRFGDCQPFFETTVQPFIKTRVTTNVNPDLRKVITQNLSKLKIEH